MIQFRLPVEDNASHLIRTLFFPPARTNCARSFDLYVSALLWCSGVRDTVYGYRAHDWQCVARQCRFHAWQNQKCILRTHQMAAFSGHRLEMEKVLFSFHYMGYMRHYFIILGEMILFIEA